MRPSNVSSCVVASSFVLSLLAASVQAAGRADNNAINGVDLLSGFNTLWIPGATWNTGTPTALGAPILQRNVQYVVDLSHTRTREQEIAAYYDDRRNQSYSAIDGLGSLADGYRAGSGAFTTITTFDDSNQTVKYDDKGNGAGETSSALGKVVQLVGAVRNDASTTPAKNAYQYPRPWRQTQEEIIQPSLRPARSSTPETDGGFPSGHTNAAYLSSIALSYAIPQRFEELMLRASEVGNNRIVAGMHSPFDVIGGRITATYFAIDNLTNNAQLRNEAFQQAQAYFTEQCGGDINNCMDPIDPATDRFSQHAQDKALYTSRMTYGFAPVGPTDLAPVVPVNAEVLLETRFPYLDASQRRDVLASTEISSGYVVIDESNGYGRLNLLAAGDGYGAFTSDVTVNMDASLGGFNAKDAWRNNISGSGGLIKNGTGELTLSGENTYTGGTTINGGTLRGYARAFGSGAITNNATLVLDQSVDDTMGNTLAGNGSLIKSGAGSLDLTGNSSFSGTTAVNEGRLAVNGSLANSAVTVNQGATLGGNGTVGTLVVAQGGIVAPGNSVGQLNVNGNVTLANGAVYQVETNEAGQTDRIVATGSATIENSTLSLVQSGNWQPLTRYSILTANGGVTGTFANVTSNYAFLTPTLSYSANGVELALERNSTTFASLGTTRNERAVAAGLDSVVAGSALWDQVAQLDTATAQQTFRALSNELHASTQTALVEDSRLVRNAMTDRLHNAQVSAADTAPGMQNLMGDNARGVVWTQALGAWGKTDSTHNVSGLDTHTTGILLGADAPLNDTWRLGALAGYSHSDFDLRHTSGSSKSDNYHLGLYAGAQWDALSLKLGAAHTWHDIDAKRTLSVLGSADRLSPNYDAGTTQVFGELGYLIRQNQVTLEPFAGLAHVRVHTDSFHERSGALALDNKSQDTDVTFSTLGLRASTTASVGSVQLKPSATLGWRHAFGDVTPEHKAAFEGGNTFTLEGAPIARNAAVIEGAVGMALNETVSVGISYGGQLSSDTTDQNVKANLTLRF
ncbi:autotransporter domain-containing protein [Pseudomonas luteola]